MISRKKNSLKTEKYEKKENISFDLQLNFYCRGINCAIVAQIFF